jgi:predicted alpha/beta-fold hydrolase
MAIFPVQPRFSVGDFADGSRDSSESVLNTTCVSAGREQKPKAFPSYRAPWWLPGGHLQTIYAYYLRRAPAFTYRRERWETPDGDFIDLDWLSQPDSSALVVLFHGLEGCSSSHYAITLMNALQHAGWSGVVPHFRGCSGVANRLKRAYHSGDSAELDWILHRIKESSADARLYTVGVSLGGNVLLKWLGEQGDHGSSVVEAAAAVSTPFDLEVAAERLDRGMNQLIYTKHFLRTLKRKALDKLITHGLHFDRQAMSAAIRFREFDELYTAPLHGFESAADYWRRSSSKPWLKAIRVSTLLINARNDPFYPGDALPTQAEVSDAVMLAYSDTGGHVGFVSGRFPGHLNWLSARIVDFFRGGESSF